MVTNGVIIPFFWCYFTDLKQVLRAVTVGFFPTEPEDRGPFFYDPPTFVQLSSRPIASCRTFLALTGSWLRVPNRLSRKHRETYDGFKQQQFLRFNPN